MLSTTVSAVFPANTSSNTVKHIGQEQTEQRGPHEGKCLDTELGDLAIVTESATGLDEDSSHQGSDQSLEEQGEMDQESREPTANPHAHGRESSEEGDHTKEQGDDHEGEHEPGHQEVVVGTDELVRNIDGSTKVPVTRRVKGERRSVPWAIHLAVDDRTHVPKRPSRQSRSTRNGTGVGFEKVDDVQRIRISCTTQERQEHQQERRGCEEQAQEAQCRSGQHCEGCDSSLPRDRNDENMPLASILHTAVVLHQC